jgi:Zn-dependent M28 family amino/carboxypeptidase
MELARVLASGPQLNRTVVVAFWGSEETGMLGAKYFLEHPTFPLRSIVVNLEFEMLGRPDPKLKSDESWLTGWNRTTLGPVLAKHGGKLVPDPRPTEKFFTRSDNYALAEKGIVAQTISSYGLHPDYHQPTDTVDKIDYEHLHGAIGSLIAPLTWLANSNFRPTWMPEMRPTEQP